MKPVIKDFGSHAPADLYALFQGIYSSSDTMVETLAEKYPAFDDFASDMQMLVHQPGAIALVAELEQKCVAYLTLRPRKQVKLAHTADLNMGVAQTARGQGLGSVLLKTALDAASCALELEIIYLMVRADNIAAVRLYESVGFEKMALLQRDTKIGTTYFDGLLMRRFIDRPGMSAQAG